MWKYRSNILWKETFNWKNVTLGYLQHKMAIKAEIIKKINAKTEIVELRKTGIQNQNQSNGNVYNVIRK